MFWAESWGTIPYRVASRGPGGSSMSQARAPVAVIYTCGLVTVGLILGLMAYVGMFDGAWDNLIENLKDLAKFFSQ